MVYIDDGIMRKGKPATAGSKMLENFIAPFDATVAARLTEDTQSVPLGEFGLEAPGVLPGFPLLCNDVFGHVRVQAAKQGLCYIRPAYGTVSRYGLIPAASSMDQIGAVAKDPFEGFALLSQVAGYDEKDGAMFPDRQYEYSKPDKRIRQGDAAPPYAGVCDQVTAILAYAEISNNISRYDGIKYGYRAKEYKGLEELYTRSRTEAFGLAAKLAAVMGCLVLSRDNYARYYEKALKIRRLIKESLRFDEYDVIALPPESHLAVLCGLPSLTFGETQWMADVKNEGALLAVWEAAQ